MDRHEAPRSCPRRADKAGLALEGNYTDLDRLLAELHLGNDFGTSYFLLIPATLVPSIPGSLGGIL